MSRLLQSQRGEGYFPAIMVLVAMMAVAASLTTLVFDPPGVNGPPVGDFRLATDPPGAVAYMDGRNLGRTPVVAPRVETGQHLVKFELGGYRSYTARHKLEPAQPEPVLKIALTPEPKGSIAVRSEPEGAKVYVSGEFRGHSPIDIGGLAPGTYTVLVRNTNCEPWTAHVNVPPEGTVELKAELEDKVLRFLLAAVEAEPTNVTNYTDLGHYYFIRGMVKESVAAYSRGLELGYMRDVAKGDLGRHEKEIKKHQRWPSTITPKFKEMLAAERLRLAQKYPANAVSARQTARSFLASGKPQEAIKILRTTIANVPENVELHYELGRAYLVAKDSNKALMSFETALATSPNDLYLRRRVASECIDKRVLFTSDDDRRALSKLAKKVLGDVIDRGFDRYAKAKGHYDLGRLYAEDELLEHAAKHMSEALRLGTKGIALVRWQLDLAGVYASLGKDDEARLLYRQVLNAEMEGADALRRTARKALEKDSEPEKEE